jgi:hypothetical protein
VLFGGFDAARLVGAEGRVFADGAIALFEGFATAMVEPEV